MEHIILIGHGSPLKEANNIELLGKMLHHVLHLNCHKNCVKAAYLQFAEPEILEAIKDSVKSGAKRIILHPCFLSSGIHVTKDIPEIIRDAKKAYPNVEFIYTEPIGIHEKLVQIIIERIHSANGLKPKDIEKRSLEIISEEIDLSDVPEEQLPIVKRVIHATADFEFKKTLLFHPDAIKTGINAIRAGKDILTDVEMVRVGINKRILKKWKGDVLCGISRHSEESIYQENKTRAEMGIEESLKTHSNIGIIVIGNAPTALLKVIELINTNASIFKGDLPLVVGVPVGFVKALEAKVLLSTTNLPFITNLSRKGGTPVAVAIVNSLLKMAEEVSR